MQLSIYNLKLYPLLSQYFVWNFSLTKIPLLNIAWVLLQFFHKNDYGSCGFIRKALYNEPQYVKVLWWAQMDSNHRPHAYQACALTS